MEYQIIDLIELPYICCVCYFARHRQRNKKIGKGVLGLSTVQPPAHAVPDNRLNRATGSHVTGHVFCICYFARHRQRNKKIGKGVLGLSTVQPPAHAVPDNRPNRATGSGVPANVPTGPRTPVNRATGPTKTTGKQEQDNLSHR